MNKLLLTPEEAAEVLSIGRTKVYALMADGDLISVRIGNSRRVPLEAVSEFVERLEDEARAETRLSTRMVAR
jgi:excisionase family DNA binding protein